MTPDGESVRENTESINFHDTTIIPEELLNFLAQSRPTRLRYLGITGNLQMPLWDHFTSQTTRPTVLSLQLTQKLSLSTTSQLISILVANPNLQRLSISEILPGDVDKSGSRIPLRHLKTIALTGIFRSIFRLLQQLELPATLDYTSLSMDNTLFDEI